MIDQEQEANRRNMHPDAREPVSDGPSSEVMAPIAEFEGDVSAPPGEGPKMPPVDDDKEKGEKRDGVQRTAEQKAGKGQSRERMEPLTAGRQRAPHGGGDRPDQEPNKDERDGVGEGESRGYRRLRVCGRPGKWEVLEERKVGGPLAEPTRLSHGWAWEVRYGDRRLSVGQIPDMGEVRGFPDPEGRPGMEGHHIGEPEGDHEFVVRVPEEVLGKVPVEKLEIRLYRVEAAPREDIGPKPLDAQFRGVVRLME